MESKRSWQWKPKEEKERKATWTTNAEIRQRGVKKKKEKLMESKGETDGPRKHAGAQRCERPRRQGEAWAQWERRQKRRESDAMERGDCACSTSALLLSARDTAAAAAAAAAPPGAAGAVAAAVGDDVAALAKARKTSSIAANHTGQSQERECGSGQ